MDHEVDNSHNRYRAQTDRTGKDRADNTTLFMVDTRPDEIVAERRHMIQPLFCFGSSNNQRLLCLSLGFYRSNSVGA